MTLWNPKEEHRTAMEALLRAVTTNEAERLANRLAHSFETYREFGGLLPSIRIMEYLPGDAQTLDDPIDHSACGDVIRERIARYLYSRWQETKCNRVLRLTWERSVEELAGAIATVHKVDGAQATRMAVNQLREYVLSRYLNEKTYARFTEEG